MDRHPRRHGQAVERGDRARLGLWSRVAFGVLVVVCLGVALAAARWGLSAQDGGTGTNESDAVDVSAGAIGDDALSPNGDGAPPAGGEDGGASTGAASGGSPSKHGAFLDALARDAADADLSHDGVAARQAWTEDRSLPQAAADVLRGYADEPTASLAMSGYLDIKGDVWGAVVRDARGWVDMVSCTAGENDASCHVSVVRLAPKAQGQTESEGS